MPEDRHDILARGLYGAEQGFSNSIEGIQAIPSLAQNLWEGYPEFARKFPTVGHLVTHLKRRYVSMSPEERQDVLDMAGEIVGSTGGAIIGVGGGGGIGSMATGAVGAVSGGIAGNTLAKLVGPILGAEGFDPNETLGDVAEDFGRIAGENIGEEGFGILAERGLRPSTYTNAARRPFTPKDGVWDPMGNRMVPRADINRVADKYGVSQTLAQRSGRPTAKFAEQVLGVWPSSIETIHHGTRNTIEDISSLFLDAADDIHPRYVSPEDIANRAAREYGDAQVHIAQRMGDATDSLPGSRAGGEAWEASREATIDDWKALGDELYQQDPRISSHYGHEIDMTPASDRIKKLKETKFTANELGLAFPQQANDALNAIAAARPRVEGLTGTTVPTRMSFEQLKNLRTTLLERSRRFNPQTPAMDRRSVNAMIEAIDDTILNSDLPQEAKEAWVQANQVYAKRTQEIFQPGNKQAEIGTRIEPEKIPGKIAQPGTDASIENVFGAIQPRSGRTPEADVLSGSILREAYADPSRVPMPMDPHYTYVSPGRVMDRRSKMGSAIEPHLGPQGSRLFDEAGQLRPLEERYATGPVGRAVSRYANLQLKPDDLLSRMAPDKDPRVFRDTLQGLSDEGQSMLRRAKVDNLIDESSGRDRFLGMPITIMPTKLEKKMRDAQESLFGVAGGGDQRFADALTLGLTAKELETILGNISGTARMGASLSLGEKLASKAAQVPKSVMTGGSAGMFATGTALGFPLYAAGSVALPWAAAKAVTNPKVAKWLTKTPTATVNRGPIAAAIARASTKAVEGDAQPHIDPEDFRRWQAEQESRPAQPHIDPEDFRRWQAEQAQPRGPLR